MPHSFFTTAPLPKMPRRTSTKSYGGDGFSFARRNSDRLCWSRFATSASMSFDTAADNARG